MNDHNSEKLKLEKAALDHFLTTYNKLKNTHFICETHRDKPDFRIKDSVSNETKGVEVTYDWYDAEEAKILLNRSEKTAYVAMSSTHLISKTNELLHNKNNEARNYDLSYPVILLIRIPSRVFDKDTFDMFEDDIEVPCNCLFEEMWLLLHNPEQQNWNDLKQIM